MKISKSLSVFGAEIPSLHIACLQENSCSANWKCPVLEIQRPIMPKATKSFAHGEPIKVPPPEELVQSSQEELSSSDPEPYQEVSFQHHRQLPASSKHVHALH